MDNKNPNPLHSPHIQALRQLMQKGYGGRIEDVLELLEEESETDPGKIKEMNEEWNSILYASKSIDHLMISTFDFFPQVHKTSPEAQAILSVMLRTQEQATGLVEVKKSVYAKVLGWGSKRAGHIDDCLQELKDVKAILPIYEPPEGTKKKPGIYQINPQFSKIGKGFKVSAINPGASGEYTQYPHKVTLLINGQKKELTCGSLQKIIKTDSTTAQKKRANAGLVDPQSEPLAGSEPQDDSNRPAKKNQDFYTSNMQNTENLLTQTEEDFFSIPLSQKGENNACKDV